MSLARRYGRARAKTVTRKVVEEIHRHMQDDFDMARTAGEDVESAELTARENAAVTFIERGYDREGVWLAMGPIKGGRP